LKYLLNDTNFLQALHTLEKHFFNGGNRGWSCLGRILWEIHGTNPKRFLESWQVFKALGLEELVRSKPSECYWCDCRSFQELKSSISQWKSGKKGLIKTALAAIKHQMGELEKILGDNEMG